jgi:hypothetical protein
MTEAASPKPESTSDASADEIAKPLSNKERMTIGRVSMPEQEGEVRAGNFREVNLPPGDAVRGRVHPDQEG